MNVKKYLSGLWHSAKKKAKGATDSELGQFRAKIDGLIAERGKLDDAGIKSAVEELKGYLSDLPESDEKSTLTRVLDDFGVGLKDQDDATAKQAGDMVSDLYEKLETDASTDVEPAKDGAQEPKEGDKSAAAAGEGGTPGGSGAEPTTPKTPTDKKPEDGAPVVEPDGDEPLTGEEVKALRALLAKATAPAAGVGDGCDGGKAGDSKSSAEGDKKPEGKKEGDGKAEDSTGEFKTSVGTKESAQALDEFLDKHTFGRK